MLTMVLCAAGCWGDIGDDTPYEGLKLSCQGDYRTSSGGCNGSRDSTEPKEFPVPRKLIVTGITGVKWYDGQTEEPLELESATANVVSGPCTFAGVPSCNGNECVAELIHSANGCCKAALVAKTITGKKFKQTYLYGLYAGQGLKRGDSCD